MKKMFLAILAAAVIACAMPTTTSVFAIRGAFSDPCDNSTLCSDADAVAVPEKRAPFELYAAIGILIVSGLVVVGINMANKKR